VEDEPETAEAVEESDETVSEEAEDSVESDEEPAPEPVAEEQTESKKQHMIPKDRLDQELAKRRQLENKLKELEERTNSEKAETKVDFDFDDAETKYMNAVLDGETEKAKQIRAEIRQMERQQLQNELQASMQQTSQQTQAQIRLEAAVKEVVSAYPQLDLNAAEADQDLINETNELMTGFMSQGYDPVDALSKAVGYTTKSLGVNMDVDQPAVIPNAETRDLSAEKSAKRRQESAEKREKAQTQQPPKLSGESQRSRDDNVVDIFKMSDKDWNNLSDEQLRKLRGDFG